MQCAEVRTKLAGSERNDEDVTDHVALCELCQRHEEDLRLTRILKSLVVPEPDEAFLEAAMIKSTSRPMTRARQWHRVAAAAVFAMVCMMLGSWLPLTSERQASPGIAGTLASESGQVQHVSIVIYSNAEQDAELFIALAENLELEGFAGQHSLTWNARLNEGKNLLRLPVVATGDGGELQVKSRFAGREHHVQLRIGTLSVTPRDSGSIMPSGRDKSA